MNCMLVTLCLEGEYIAAMVIGVLFIFRLMAQDCRKAAALFVVLSGRYILIKV